MEGNAHSPRPEPFMPELHFGPYYIKRELGRGAMGVVYEAYDPARKVDVALKVMTPPAGASVESQRLQIERFSQEARTLEDLCHFHIVRIFDQGEINGRYYLSMELVRGTTLRDRIRYQGPLSLPELLRLVADICGALDYIHEKGVIHRDVKPENLMLLPDGRFKLMDFGIALPVSVEGPYSAHGFQGSPAYMSPEQVAGEPLDGRSDLYSLAVTLYEAATGRRAFEADNIPSILYKVSYESPQPPTGLPPYFSAALMRGLAKDRLRRYARAGDMAADILAQRLPPGTPLPAAPLAALPDGRPGAAPQAALGRRACAMHPSTAAIALCSSCRRGVCYGCFVEVPTRGVICRACAFGA